MQNCRCKRSRCKLLFTNINQLPLRVRHTNHTAKQDTQPIKQIPSQEGQLARPVCQAKNDETGKQSCASLATGTPTRSLNCLNKQCRDTSLCHERNTLNWLKPNEPATATLNTLHSQEAQHASKPNKAKHIALNTLHSQDHTICHSNAFRIPSKANPQPGQANSNKQMQTLSAASSCYQAWADHSHPKTPTQLLLWAPHCYRDCCCGCHCSCCCCCSSC